VTRNVPSKKGVYFVNLKLITTETVAMTELISAIPSFTEALKVSMRKSGKTEKQFYCELEIDAAQWSRIMSSQAHFPQNKLVKFCEISENDIVLEWFAYNRGYEIRVIPKTLEDQLEKERSEKEEAINRVKYLEELLLRREEKK
jgi:hypothetical protein